MNLEEYILKSTNIKYHNIIPKAGNNSRSPINDEREKTCDRHKMLLADVIGRNIPVLHLSFTSFQKQ